MSRCPLRFAPVLKDRRALAPEELEPRSRYVVLGAPLGNPAFRKAGQVLYGFGAA
jgi:hypothetical protein